MGKSCDEHRAHAAAHGCMPLCCFHGMRRTVRRAWRMAMIAAMKKVLSPISDAPMTPIDLPTASMK